ncbi:MAG: tetratricopeptide repeat protein [Myxococcales bacterium]|nr:tetratricopeptide repeat protein [Myxococcales bacterium]
MAALDREKTLQAAQKLVDKDKFDKAIIEYRKLVDSDPADVRTLLKIGDLHLKLQQFEPAIVVYEKVGEHYFREGFAVKAIAVFKQIRGIMRRHAQELDAKFAHILPRLAEIYTQLGLTSDALAAYDEVATRLRQEGRVRDALDVFKVVVGLDPQNPIAHLRVADSRARLGDIDKAVDSFGEAARIMLSLGRIDDALKVLERLLEYRPDPNYARLAGTSYLERGQPNDGMAALSKLQIAFKANPKDLATLKILTRAFDAINQPTKALEVLKEAARVARDGGDQEEFATVAAMLSARAPDDPQTRSLLAQLRARTGRPPGGPAVEIDDAESVDEALDVESLDELIPASLPPSGGPPSEGPRSAGTSEQPGRYQQSLRPQASPDAAYAIETANAYRAAGHVAYATELLRAALAQEDSFDVRLLMSDLLLEGGDQASAIEERLYLANSAVAMQDGALGIQMLDDVLLLEPEHEVATQFREQLYAHFYNTAQAYPGDAPAPERPLGTYDVEFGGVDEALRLGAVAATSGIIRTGQQQAALDETLLDQVDALCEAGQLVEARALLMRQLAITPNHPLLIERLEDLGDEPGAESYVPEPPPSVSLYIDTAAYRHGGAAHRGVLNPSPPGGFAEADRAPMSGQTQYDLGIEYLERGMHAEAVAALSIAAQEPMRECVCLSIIASLHIQAGDLVVGIETLHRALGAEHRTREQELALGYELGHHYEESGNREHALHFFEWVALVEPAFVDPRGALTERVSRLKKAGTGPDAAMGTAPGTTAAGKPARKP